MAGARWAILGVGSSAKLTRPSVTRALQVAQHRPGLVAERREGPDEPERHGERQGGKRDQDRRPGQPYEGDLHDFGHDQKGGDRARRQAEQRGGKPKKQAYTRVVAYM